MDDTPEKKLKIVAGSSSNEVTNTILASVQEQNNDEVMAQEGDALFVGEPELWLTSFPDEDFELLRGIFWWGLKIQVIINRVFYGWIVV